MKHNASSDKRILQRPKRHMMKPFLQMRYLLIFGRKTEEGREVGAEVMCSRSRQWLTIMSKNRTDPGVWVALNNCVFVA